MREKLWWVILTNEPDLKKYEVQALGMRRINSEFP